jgi:hypothetical protein
MTRVALHQADMVTVSMIVVVVAEAMVAMIPTATVAPVEMIVVTVVTADVIAMMDTLLVASTAMPDVMIATAAAETSDVAVAVAVAEDILIVMSEVVIATVDAHPEMLLQLPHMVTQPLVESLGSHMEVETMMRDTPVVAIDR